MLFIMNSTFLYPLHLWMLKYMFQKPQWVKVPFVIFPLTTREPHSALFVIGPEGGWHIYCFLVSDLCSHCRLYIWSEKKSDRHWGGEMEGEGGVALYRGKYLKYTSGPQCPLQHHTPPMQGHYSAEDVSLPFGSDQQLHKPFWKGSRPPPCRIKHP